MNPAVIIGAAEPDIHAGEPNELLNLNDDCLIAIGRLLQSATVFNLSVLANMRSLKKVEMKGICLTHDDAQIEQARSVAVMDPCFGKL